MSELVFVLAGAISSIYVLTYWVYYLSLFDARAKWYESIPLAMLTLLWPVFDLIKMMEEFVSKG